jgi:hypothetical protein
VSGTAREKTARTNRRDFDIATPFLVQGEAFYRRAQGDGSRRVYREMALHARAGHAEAFLGFNLGM